MTEGVCAPPGPWALKQFGALKLGDARLSKER